MKVGDKVYLLPDGNMTRGIKDSLVNHIIETEIKSIGRKYITVNFGGGIKFRLDEKYNGGYAEHTDYCCDYYMFESRQEILDMFEEKELSNKINLCFSTYSRQKFSLDQLKRIINIIEE